MAVKLRPAENAPEIREQCPSCGWYEQHLNGSIQIPAPLDITVDLDPLKPKLRWACATQCLRCSWITIYR